MSNYKLKNYFLIATYKGMTQEVFIKVDKTKFVTRALDDFFALSDKEKLKLCRTEQECNKLQEKFKDIFYFIHYYTDFKITKLK